MPKPGLRLFLFLLCLVPLVAVTAQMAKAQDALDEQVAARMAAAKSVFGAVPPPKRCEAASDDEIVVCARGSSDRYRVSSTAESDPNSREAQRALNNGVPRAPDMEPHYQGVSVARGCFIPPCPKEPIYDAQVASLPQAPEGSDADRIAKGEAAAP